LLSPDGAGELALYPVTLFIKNQAVSFLTSLDYPEDQNITISIDEKKQGTTTSL